MDEKEHTLVVMTIHAHHKAMYLIHVHCHYALSFQIILSMCTKLVGVFMPAKGTPQVLSLTNIKHADTHCDHQVSYNSAQNVLSA